MSLIQPDTGVAPTPKHYVVYTDGSCLGTKSGPGGYSVIIICGSERKELAGGVRLTTAYRMEIRAVITALQSITQPSTITVCCDSLHLGDGSQA